MGKYHRNIHNALILGYDTEEKVYYYLDSPPTRNPQFFIPYENNPAIGKIKKRDLLNSFKLCCQIGYLIIKEEDIERFPDFSTLIYLMSREYFKNSEIRDSNVVIYKGKFAFQQIFEELDRGTDFSVFSKDSFVSALFYSRCIRLKNNLSSYFVPFSKEICVYLQERLEALAAEWKIVEMYILKRNLQQSKCNNGDLYKFFVNIEKYTNEIYMVLNDFYAYN